MTTPPSNDKQQRRLWHDLVDRAVAKANGKPLSAQDVLNSVGIFRWTPYHPQAIAYATKMLDAHTKAATTKPKKGKP
jgi:hypothetical protein